MKTTTAAYDITDRQTASAPMRDMLTTLSALEALIRAQRRVEDVKEDMTDVCELTRLLEVRDVVRDRFMALIDTCTYGTRRG